MKPIPSDYLNKSTVLSKVDTTAKKHSRTKTVAEFSRSIAHSTTQIVEEVLKKDVLGLSVDNIKPLNRRTSSKK